MGETFQPVPILSRVVAPVTQMLDTLPLIEAPANISRQVRRRSLHTINKTWGHGVQPSQLTGSISPGLCARFHSSRGSSVLGKASNELFGAAHGMRLACERAGASRCLTLILDRAEVLIWIEPNVEKTLCGRCGGLGFSGCAGVVCIKDFTFALLALCLE